jgi:hypothetical protein
VGENPDVDEEYDGEGRGTGVEHEETQEQTQEPFDPALIDVQTRNPTVSLLLSRLRRGVLDLDADFQRKAGLWTEVKQSRLIESLLLRIPLPTLYAAETGEDGWTVVDGIQRLTTIARFVVPEAVRVPPGEKPKGPLRLAGLEYLQDYNGLTYTELPGGLQTRIDETELVIHLIRHGTPEAVMFNIFARINTGGLPLTQQELRHALIKGHARDLLRELASDEAFLAATQHTINPDRMADREMILRFIAFHRVKTEEYKQQDLDAFLRESMKAINSVPPEEVNRLIADFERSMQAAQSIFGEHAFRKFFEGQTRRLPINKALFEAVAVNLARLSPRELKILEERRYAVMGGMADLMKDEQFLSSISYATGNARRVQRRFSGLRDMLQGMLA